MASHGYAVTECVAGEAARNRDLLAHVDDGMRRKLGDKIAEVLLRHGACTVHVQRESVFDDTIRGRRFMLTATFWKPGPINCRDAVPDWAMEPDNV